MFKFTHTRLLVSKYKECFRFYRDVMGFKPTYGTEDGTYADFAANEVTIALFAKKEMSTLLGTTQKTSRSGQDVMSLIFEVSSVDEAYQLLKTKGVKFVLLPTDRPDWGIRTAHFRDPDGNLIEINQELIK